MELLRYQGIKLRACLRGVLIALILAIVGGYAAQGQELWTSEGPDGGDARALAAVPGQPNHLYLGTTSSFIYESTDEGASWHPSIYNGI